MLEDLFRQVYGKSYTDEILHSKEYIEKIIELEKAREELGIYMNSDNYPFVINHRIRRVHDYLTKAQFDELMKDPSKQELFQKAHGISHAEVKFLDS